MRRSDYIKIYEAGNENIICFRARRKKAFGRLKYIEFKKRVI